MLVICWAYSLCQITFANIFKEIIKYHKNHSWDEKNSEKI